MDGVLVFRLLRSKVLQDEGQFFRKWRRKSHSSKTALARTGSHSRAKTMSGRVIVGVEGPPDKRSPADREQAAKNQILALSREFAEACGE